MELQPNRRHGPNLLRIAESVARQHDPRVCLPQLVVPRQHRPLTGKLQLRFFNHADQHKSIPKNPLHRSSQIRHLRRHSPLHAHSLHKLLRQRPIRNNKLCWSARVADERMGQRSTKIPPRRRLWQQRVRLLELVLGRHGNHTQRPP